MDCRGCGQALDEDARFCKRCGRPIEGVENPAATSPEVTRERKVATLLFADLVGYTALNEAQDPELVSPQVAGAFERLAAEVERYEGTIEKFAGDAILAVFGVPAAHEDDPERAVRAALDMQAAMARLDGDEPDPPQLSLRIGIETGEVLVDQARASAERDRFLTGDAVNVAARLEAAAAPGTVVVGPAARNATRNTVDYEELRALRLKGKSAPVSAWRAVAVRTRQGGLRAPLGLESPLVGRDVEMARLVEAVRVTVETRRPHLVTIIGSAGVGKSRLARELEDRVEEGPGRSRWLKGRCLAYADSSYGALADIIKADAGITDDDSATSEERLRERLAELALADGSDDVREALEATLAVGGGRVVRRDQMVSGWERYLHAVAQETPLVLTIEDIHWADDALLSFLAYQARWSEGPILILCLARHELIEQHPHWGAGLPEAATVTLEPLTTDKCATLLDGLLAGGAPEELRDHVVRLTEGNPLFVEEVVRMLIDDGVLRSDDGSWRLARPVEEIVAPGSVEAVIAARLDSLPHEEKRVALDAAVIGRVFWDRLVAHLAAEDTDRTSERIAGLLARDLVVPRLDSSLVGAAEYSFRHVLIRDVAYDSLPKRDRARLHKQIALWAEERLADRIDAFSELVASHYVAALTYQEELAAGATAELRETRELAHSAAWRAARRAASLGLVLRACHWTWTAVDLGRALDHGTREAARLADEDASSHALLTQAPDHVERLSRVVDDLAALPRLDDEDEQRLARLRCALAEALRGADDHDRARVILHAGIERLRAGGPTPGRARLYRTLGWICHFADRPDEAKASLESAVADARACSDGRTLRWALMDSAIGASRDPDERVEMEEEAFRLALEADDRGLLKRCHNNLPVAYEERGDPLGPAMAVLKDGLELARRETEGGSDVSMVFNLAVLETEMGLLDDALAHIDEAISASLASGLPLGALLVMRALHFRQCDDIATAERIEAELEGTGVDMETGFAYFALLGRAFAEWPRDPQGALAGLAQHLERADAMGDRQGYVPRLVARMALRVGDLDLVQRAVEQHRRNRGLDTGVVGAVHGSMDGLIAIDTGTMIEHAAATLEEGDRTRHALEAWADAALLAARAGRPSRARERALAIIERTGMHHLLGPLPETRWLSPGSG